MLNKEKQMRIRCFHPIDEPAVIDLWRRCELLRPQNDPHTDIEQKLKLQADLFLVAECEGQIVGTVMAGYEGHRGWINYLAVSPQARGTGIGRALMQEAERRLRGMGCPKINLQVRSANRAVIGFYRAVGFSMDDVISMGKRLENEPRAAAAAEPLARIRAIAICIFRNGERILVAEGIDHVKAERFARPLGGAIEPGETSQQAVIREIGEELSQQVIDLRLLGVLENIFDYQGRPHHERVFVYDGRFEDASVYAVDELKMTEPGWDSPARWRRLNSFGAACRLVPEGLIELLARKA
jgi:ribosomal protein S18 acetylase RimI-like enzyme/ADP-ribose pyrophosphatase YjhB (NUDIX family)